METPPAIPPTKPPLGTRFYIIFLTPLVLMAVFLCCVNSSTLALPLMSLAGLATFVCSILLARQIAARMSPTGQATVGMSILMFFAVQALYAACFFVGCTAAVALG